MPQLALQWGQKGLTSTSRSPPPHTHTSLPSQTSVTATLHQQLGVPATPTGLATSPAFSFALLPAPPAWTLQLAFTITTLSPGLASAATALLACASGGSMQVNVSAALGMPPLHASLLAASTLSQLSQRCSHPVLSLGLQLTPPTDLLQLVALGLAGAGGAAAAAPTPAAPSAVLLQACVSSAALLAAAALAWWVVRRQRARPAAPTGSAATGSQLLRPPPSPRQPLPAEAAAFSGLRMRVAASGSEGGGEGSKGVHMHLRSV